MCTVRRIDLPSGGWWEIETRPRWKHLRGWLDGLRQISSAREQGESEQVDRMLVSLTVAWSFDLPLKPQYLSSIDTEDIVAVLEVLRREVVPYWKQPDRKAMAEELFSGLAAGTVPQEFEEVHVMALTGWSWEVLQDTPADIVEKMATYLAVTSARDSDGTVDFPEDRHER